MLAIASYVSILTLHFESSILFLNSGMSVFNESGPIHSAYLQAALVAPYLTSLFSSSNKSIIFGRSLVVVMSLERIVTIIAITSVTPART